MNKETSELIKHINFTFARFKSFLLTFCLFLFYFDLSYFILFYYIFILFFYFILDLSPFSHFLYPNPHNNYYLEGRESIFKGDNEFNKTISLILKEETKDGIIKIFELFYFVIVVYY
jgi:hypothetical protein